MSKKGDKSTFSFLETNKPHDLLFKRTFEEFPEVAKELIQAHIPEELMQQLDLNHFELCNKEMFSPIGATRVADVVVKTGIENTDAEVYLTFFIFEHQSSNDPLMAFRMLQYVVLVLDSYIKEQEGKGITRGKIKLPLVYPAVFYHGKNKATFSNDVRELIAAPKDLVKEFFLQSFKLIDFTQITDENLKAHNWAGLTELCFKYSFKQAQADFMRMLELYEEIAQNAYRAKPIENNVNFIEMLAEYLITTGSFDKPDAHSDIIKASSKITKEADEMGTIANNLIQKGRLEGELSLIGRLAAARFGVTLSEVQRAKLQSLTLQELEEIGVKLLNVETFDELFK